MLTPNSSDKVFSSSAVTSADRINGTGEMADLVRAYDWKTTPVGPIETWSDTLVTTVNLLLASRHPMFLWWGTDLIQFYNDGYRPCIRADKHPSALGQRGAECWPEIWPIIGPQIEAVMTRGQSTWNINQLVPINRSGKLEEVFWTYSYSPVRGQDGTVQGTLVVCSETTEQVLSDRRLRALLAITTESQDRGEPSHPESLFSVAQNLVKQLAFDAADLPFVTLYLVGKEELLNVASTSTGCLADPEKWSVAEVVNSQTPMLLDQLQVRFGEMILTPWPEPVTRAYVLPLHLPGFSVQAVLVCGISPRLPFDDAYKTFLHLIGSRIASLLESELQKLEVSKAVERFRRLAEANPFGTVIGDLGGQLTYVNPSFRRAFGYSQEDLADGKIRWDVLTPPEYVEADARAIEQLRSTGRCEVYEKAYLTNDGRRIPVLFGAASIDSGKGEPEIAAFVTDLTPLKMAQEALRSANEDLERRVAERTAALEAEIADRKRAEASLRELTGRLLLTQDAERRRMARELHDHAGQTLVALAMNFALLLEMAKDQDPKIMRLLTEGQQLSDTLAKEIRTLSYLLHPPLLDEAGLRSAIEWYVEGFSKRSGITVDVALPDDWARLSKELELVVFRVVQESLTNIHRHSGSPSATIRLSRSDAEVTVEIADAGKGIPEEKKKEATRAQVGVGLRGMEERVRQFGGTLRIDSTQSGTTVTVKLPHVADASEGQ